MVLLSGGPGNGAEVDVERPWVFIAVIDGMVIVFDIDRPDMPLLLERVGTGGWSEYRQDPNDPDVYRAIDQTAVPASPPRSGRRKVPR